MHGRNKPWDLLIHQITTPPPNEKNDRKKLDAANAIDRPKTIWTSRRKPPDVSPNASDSPVTMMMITATILATGPSTDCRIWLSGCSHGIFEPADQAGAESRQKAANVTVETARRPRGDRQFITDLLMLRGCSRPTSRARRREQVRKD